MDDCRCVAIVEEIRAGVDPHTGEDFGHRVFYRDGVMHDCVEHACVLDPNGEVHRHG